MGRYPDKQETNMMWLCYKTEEIAWGSETWNKNENSNEEDYGQDQNNELWMTSHRRKEKTWEETDDDDFVG